MAWNPVAAVRRLMREELARGASVNLAFTLTVGVLVTLAGLVAARHLGPAGVGVLSIGFMLVEFASVVDNLPTSGFIRDYSHKPSREKVATVLVVKGAIGLALSVALLVAAPFVASAFRVPVSVPLTFALIPAGSIISSVAIMSYEAQRDMPRRNAPIIAEHLVRLALYSLVAFSPFLPITGVFGIALATLGGNVGGTLAGLYWIPRASPRAWDRALARQYVTFGMKTAAAGAMQKIIFWFDIMLIDLLLFHEAAGLYRTAYTLMAQLPLAAGTVTVMLYPQVSKAFQEHRPEDVRKALSLGFFYSLALALPIGLVFIAVPELLLTVLVGPEFAGAAWMLRSLALIGLVAVAFAPLEAFLPAANRPDLALKTAFVMMAVNTGLDLILIPVIGVAGAIVATAVAFIVGVGLAAYYLRHLDVPFPHVRDLIHVLSKD